MIPKTKDVISFDERNIPILKSILDQICRVAVSEQSEQTALTAALTSITHTAPGTPDYAIQDLVEEGGAGNWGFATQDEGNTVLKVILNLQTRVNELETKLKALNLLG